MKDISSKSSCLKITLFLAGEKGFHFLKHLLKKYKNMFAGVVVANDKSVEKDYAKEIIELCELENIPVFKRVDFTKIHSEYALAVSWRWLIKHEPEKLIVFHDSILPKYRGFSPLVNSLINGESEIGVSAIFGADDFDAGGIVAQSRTKITYPIKINEAIAVVNKNYLECAERVFNSLSEGSDIKSVPQNEEEATYSVWRDERDYLINWDQSSEKIRRFVDAVGYPYKGALTMLDGSAVRIIESEEFPDRKIENRDPGKILLVEGGKPVVICGSGLLKINQAVVERGENTTSLFPLPKFRIRFSSRA